MASINKNGQEQIKKVNDIKSKILELEKKQVNKLVKLKSNFS
ncbi:hypothetical protein JTS93_16675 [Clostridium botulinum]|nr:hypothetical protein [Clostridium botulinum]